MFCSTSSSKSIAHVVVAASWSPALTISVVSHSPAAFALEHRCTTVVHLPWNSQSGSKINSGHLWMMQTFFWLGIITPMSSAWQPDGSTTKKLRCRYFLCNASRSKMCGPVEVTTSLQDPLDGILLLLV